jgi:hypothetical protein
MIQKIGTQANLKDGPRNAELDKFAGGTIQAIGTQANLKESPVGLQDMIGRSVGGTIQSLGTAANLNKTPQKGWDTPSTPMSNRAVKQSK